MKYTGERIILEAEECRPNTLMYREHAERYKFASKYVSGKRVLDIACGVGYGCQILLQDGSPASIIGGDISPDAVEYAETHFAKKDKVRFSVMNAEQIDLPPASVDVVVSFETIEHLSGVDKYISGIVRALDRGGMFIVSTPNRDLTQDGVHTVDNPFHHHEFTLDEIQELLGRNFNVTEVFYQREYQPNTMTSAVNKISRFRSIYRKVVPRIIREDLRNYFWPDISLDVGVYPFKPSVRPLNYILVCKKRV